MLKNSSRAAASGDLDGGKDSAGSSKIQQVLLLGLSVGYLWWWAAGLVVYPLMKVIDDLAGKLLEVEGLGWGLWVLLLFVAAPAAPFAVVEDDDANAGGEAWSSRLILAAKSSIVASSEGAEAGRRDCA